MSMTWLQVIGLFTGLCTTSFFAWYVGYSMGYDIGKLEKLNSPKKGKEWQFKRERMN